MRKFLLIYLMLSALILYSFSLFAVDCGKYQNDLGKQFEEADTTIYKIQGIITNYECFGENGIYEINFNENKIVPFGADDVLAPLTIQLKSPADKLTIKNLNIEVQPGVVVDKVINITPDPEIIYTADAKITLENSVINGNGTVESKAVNVATSGITISMPDSLLYYFDRAVNITGSNNTLIDSIITGNSVVNSRAINITGTNNTIKSTTISNFDYGVYLDSTAQNVKLTQNEFQGAFTELVHLEPGANGDIQPIDTVSEDAKVWRHMNADSTHVKKIIGAIETLGTVELYKSVNNVIEPLKECVIKSKIGTDFEKSEELKDISQVFVCDNLNLDVYFTYVSFVNTDENNNSSGMSTFIKLSDFPTISAPAVSTPAPTTGNLTDETEIIQNEFVDLDSGDDDDGDDDDTTVNAADGGGGAGPSMPLSSKGPLECALIKSSTYDLSALLTLLLFFLLPSGLYTYKRFSL